MDLRLAKQVLSSVGLFAGVVASGLIGGLIIIYQAWQISRIVGRAYLDQENLLTLSTPLIILSVIIALRAFFNYLGEYSAGLLANRIKANIRKTLTQKIFQLGPTYARAELTGELVAVVMEGVEALDAYFNQYLPQVVLAFVIPVSMLLVVFPVDILTGVVLLLTAPLIPFFMILIGKASEKATQKQWSVLSRLSAHFLDAIQGLKTLQLFSQTLRERKKLADNIEQYRSATLKVLQIAFLSALVLELVATICTAIVAVQIGLRLLYGWLSFYEAFFVLLITPEFYFPLRQFGARFHAGMAGMTAANRIFAILETQPAARENAIVQTDLSSIIRGDRKGLEIAFENVSYRYPGRQQFALRDVSFQMETGKVTALAGVSGSGKSTAAHLLLRFMDPTGGQITLNGMDVSSISLDAWRNLCAWVPHQPYVFNETIAENICLGEKKSGLEDIRRAARMAELDDFVMALPDRYNTRVGEQGARLSAGQAQRLGLARAFLKNSPVVILDEPTSQVDPFLEEILRKTIQDLCRERTVLVIAHRILTINRADQIIVLEGGEVTEKGDHDSLVRGTGRYRSLLEAYQGQA